MGTGSAISFSYIFRRDDPTISKYRISYLTCKVATDFSVCEFEFDRKKSILVNYEVVESGIFVTKWDFWRNDIFIV